MGQHLCELFMSAMDDILCNAQRELRCDCSPEQDSHSGFHPCGFSDSISACRTATQADAGPSSLPFLEGLSEEQAPAIFALEREHEPFEVMRKVQKQILKDISQQLCIHPVPTKVSRDGLAYFTTADKQTSIAMQVSDCCPAAIFEACTGR